MPCTENAPCLPFTLYLLSRHYQFSAPLLIVIIVRVTIFLISNIISNNKDLLKKMCRILPAGVWGCPPSYNIPRGWGIRGLIESISAESNKNR
jgi:hypothetical protein